MPSGVSNGNRYFVLLVLHIYSHRNDSRFNLCPYLYPTRTVSSGVYQMAGFSFYRHDFHTFIASGVRSNRALFFFQGQEEFSIRFKYKSTRRRFLHTIKNLFRQVDIETNSAKYILLLRNFSGSLQCALSSVFSLYKYLHIFQDSYLFLAVTNAPGWGPGC